MPDITALPSLLCAKNEVRIADPECELAHILTHLHAVLCDNLAELMWLGEQDARRVSIYGPFLARSVLEVGVTALIGRFDPTRLLIVKRTQQHGAYDTQTPWNSAIRWQGDVLDKAVGEMWVSGRAYKEMTKALLGDYYVNIYWSEALRRLVDSALTGGRWLAEIKAMDLPQFSSSRRDTLSKLYSESSKGIHSEFVVPPGALYDKATVSTLATRTLQTLAELGLIANMLPHLPYRTSPEEAVALFNEIEAFEVLR